MAKPNSGSLRANKKKTSDKHPNAKGSANIDGVEYWISAWTNEGDDGEKYQSLKFERKDAERATAKPAATSAPANPKPDDDVPW